MRHLKRVIAFIIVLAISVACVGPAYAAREPEPDGTQASPTLTKYAVWLDPGTKSGKLDISFQVTATGMASSLGVSYIKIYKVGSTTPVTIYGSTANKLQSSGVSYAYTYTYSGATPGAQYYADVAIYAQIGTTLDGRTLTTRTVTAP